MRINPMSDLCICGSGRVYFDCCLRDCRPKAGVLPTGMRREGCYASYLNDCCAKMTGEHYISEGVLKCFGETVGVRGLPWIPIGQTKRLRSESLTANVLCERHNGQLQPIDAVGIRFFKEIAPEGGQIVRNPFDAPELRVFRGEMLELWILKVAIGLLASGNATDRNTGHVIRAPIPTAWIQILFGLIPIPNGWGLYIRSEVGVHYAPGSAFQFWFMFADGILNGMITVVHNVGLALVMNDPPPSKVGTIFEGATYRPGQITIRNGDHVKAVRFYWERPPDVEMDIAIEYSPA